MEWDGELLNAKISHSSAAASSLCGMPQSTHGYTEIYRDIKLHLPRFCPCLRFSLRSHKCSFNANNAAVNTNDKYVFKKRINQNGKE